MSPLRLKDSKGPDAYRFSTTEPFGKLTSESGPDFEAAGPDSEVNFPNGSVVDRESCFLTTDTK